MDGVGVSDVSAGACEEVVGMVNGTCVTMGFIVKSIAVGDGSSVGAETRIDNEFAEVGGFSECDRGGFGKKVLG